MGLSRDTVSNLAVALGSQTGAKEINDAINLVDELSAAEVAFLDGITAGTSAASKAVVLDSSSKIDVLDITTPKIGGTAITATALEINQICDSTGRIVDVTASATALALTAALHAGRIVLVPIITGAGLTITLPAATGTGDKYTIINNGVQTVSLTVTALTGDIMYGKAIGWHLTAGANDLFYPTAADIKYTFNVTTTGGDGGDIMELWDIGTDKWLVNVEFTGSGTLATGFA